MKKVLAAAATAGFLFVLSSAFYHSWQVELLQEEVEKLQAGQQSGQEARLSVRAEQEPEGENTQGQEASDGELQQASSPQQGFYLKEEDSLVTVYRADRQTVYERTNISVEALPEAVREEVAAGKYLKSELELYSFLENYSS